MRRLSLALLALLLVGRPAWAETNVYFSPNGGCTQAIVKELNRARSAVQVQAYLLTSAPIAKALVAANRRGVKVQVILDASQRTDKYSDADFLANSGITVRFDAKHGTAHNKVMVIDGQVVITGSFNFTKAAEEENAENLLVIRDRQIAARYAQNWKEHFNHSDAYEQRQKGVSENQSGAASAGFVGSRTSQVFHKPGCKFAENIAPSNLVKYATRQDALKAGKRPCRECNP